jgi:hypothetical protein
VRRLHDNHRLDSQGCEEQLHVVVHEILQRRLRKVGGKGLQGCANQLQGCHSNQGAHREWVLSQRHTNKEKEQGENEEGAQAVQKKHSSNNNKKVSMYMT